MKTVWDEFSSQDRAKLEKLFRSEAFDLLCQAFSSLSDETGIEAANLLIEASLEGATDPMQIEDIKIVARKAADYRKAGSGAKPIAPSKHRHPFDSLSYLLASEEPWGLLEDLDKTGNDEKEPAIVMIQ